MIYFFNTNRDDKGRHEVHTSECSHLPSVLNRELIGYSVSCSEAISKAKSEHPLKEFDGCFYCCTNCHKG